MNNTPITQPAQKLGSLNSLTEMWTADDMSSYLDNNFIANYKDLQSISGSLTISVGLSSNTISSNTLTSNTINSNTLTSNTINSNTLTSNTINSNTLTSNTISSNTLTSNTISANNYLGLGELANKNYNDISSEIVSTVSTDYTLSAQDQKESKKLGDLRYMKLKFTFEGGSSGSLDAYVLVDKTDKA